jgi:hypothetical protein
MKTCFHTPVPAVLLTAAALLGGWAVAHAAPAAKPASVTAAQNETNSSETEIPRSVFIIPTNPKEGRDPFFPNSARLSATRPVRIVPASVEVPLVLNGLSGSPQHRLAIINYQTFAEGEEHDVNSPSGRIRVRCVEIKGQKVVVEVAGERRELLFESR